MQDIKKRILVFILGLAITGIASLLALDSSEIKKSYCGSAMEGK